VTATSDDEVNAKLECLDLPIVAARRPSAVNAHFSDRETFAADGPDQWRFA